MMVFATRRFVCRGAFCVALSVLLSACAGKASRPVASEPVLPPESFKVHPGLVGLPVPPELQPAVEKNIRREAERDETVMLADAVRVPEDEAGLRTQTRFYFDEGQSQVKPEFAALLAAHGRYLATHPKLRARIEGDADTREADDRKALGLRRARAVRQALLAAGAKSRQLEVVSLGDAQPRQGNDEGSGVENRRVDLRYLD